jgi:hypothetical protein
MMRITIRMTMKMEMVCSWEGLGSGGGGGGGKTLPQLGQKGLESTWSVPHLGHFMFTAPFKHNCFRYRHYKPYFSGFQVLNGNKYPQNRGFGDK